MGKKRKRLKSKGRGRASELGRGCPLVLRGDGRPWPGLRYVLDIFKKL